MALCTTKFTKTIFFWNICVATTFNSKVMCRHCNSNAHFTRGHLGWVLFVWAFIDYTPNVFRQVSVFPFPLGFGTTRWMRHWISQQNSLRILSLYHTTCCIYSLRKNSPAMYLTMWPITYHMTYFHCQNLGGQLRNWKWNPLLIDVEHTYFICKLLIPISYVSY